MNNIKVQSGYGELVGWKETFCYNCNFGDIDYFREDSTLNVIKLNIKMLEFVKIGTFEHWRCLILSYEYYTILHNKYT